MAFVDFNMNQGVNTDIPAHIAPFNHWSDGKNVRFGDGGVFKGPGYTVERAASREPMFLMEARSPSASYHVYGDLEKVYAFSGANHAEITRTSSDYGGSASIPVTGGMLSGLLFINNGVDTPQVWNPISLSQLLVDHSAWPASTYAACMRPFSNYLVALNITKTSTVYPRMVKWSHAAVPGAAPTSWDETDASIDAGEVVLGDGTDILIDCKALGPRNIIYGEKSTWAMRYVGAPYVFAFDNIFRESGIMGVDCVQQIQGGHFVVTLDDVVFHNGSELKSIIDNQMKRWFLANINPDQYYKTRTVTYYKNREVWIMFPYQTATLLNKALVWNWVDNGWSIQDIPDCYSAAAVSSEILSSGGDYWDGLSGTWDAGFADEWGGGLASGKFVGSVILGDLANSQVIRYDQDVDTQDGNAFTAYVERKGLDVSKRFDGVTIHDPQIQRMCTSVWPRVEAESDSEQFTVKVGHHDSPGGTVIWDDSGIWTPASDNIDLYATGRYLAVRFEHSQNGSPWRLNGFALDVVPLGVV